MLYAYNFCKKRGKVLKAKGFLKAVKESWALLAPVIILGYIYSGMTSPTETAVISMFYALIISIFVYKTLKVSDLKTVLGEFIFNDFSGMFAMLS